MRKFFVLLKKEIRELVTLQTVLPLVAIVVVFYFIGQVAGDQSQKANEGRSVGVMDMDNSPASHDLAAILTQTGYQVENIAAADKEAGLSAAKEKDKKVFVYVPPGFGASLTQNLRSGVEVYYLVTNFSLMGTSKIDLTPGLVAANEHFSAQIIRQAAPQLDLAKASNPLEISDHTIIKDRTANVGIREVVGYISSQATFIPIVLMLVITFAASIIATSIASEKENKTLETLLSEPINRSAIVAAKLMAAGIVALASSAFYLIGLNSYIKGLSGPSSGGGADTAAIDQLGLTMALPDYLMLGGILFLGILTALSIALILGSFAEDTKSAQGVITPLMVLVLIPYFMVFFLDITTISTPLKALVYAIPFSHVFMAAPNIILGQYQPVIYGMIYLAALFILFIYLAGKIFSTDKILTIKLKFGKRK
jgi:ABC-2 type transport system permease protein